MDNVVNPLIYTHAFLGGVALLAGSVAIVSKKGKTWHKTSGKVFFYGMLGSALLALVIAVLPNHENGFLFSIGLFSTYLLLSGYRGLQYKNQSVSLGWDKLLSTSMIVVGTAMVLGPVVWQGAANIVLAVFGGLAVLFGIRDLRMFTNPEILRKNWLKIHLGKMTGAYIASVSAFLVVNQFFHPLLNWFLPTILGSVFITYWMVRIKKGLPSRKTT